MLLNFNVGQIQNANATLIEEKNPKKINLNEITHKQVLQAVDKINDRPRKCLNYWTARVVFYDIPAIAFAF